MGTTKPQGVVAFIWRESKNVSVVYKNGACLPEYALHALSRMNGYQTMPQYKIASFVPSFLCILQAWGVFWPTQLWQAAAPLKITSVPGGLLTWGTLEQKHLKYSLVLALPCSILLCVSSHSLWSASTESYYDFKGLRNLRKSNWFVAPNLLVELCEKKAFQLNFTSVFGAAGMNSACTHKLCKCVQLSITTEYLVGIASRSLLGGRLFPSAE